MPRYRVRLSRRALGHLTRADAWWRENRLDAPDLLESEMGAALERLALAPLSGAPYDVPGERALRRMLLSETRYHLYYELIDADVVLVVAIWHASRGRQPPLGKV